MVLLRFPSVESAEIRYCWFVILLRRKTIVRLVLSSIKNADLGNLWGFLLLKMLKSGANGVLFY